MSEQKEKDAVEEKKPPPKPPEFRNFQKLLKQVVKAPPLRNHPLRRPKKLA